MLKILLVKTSSLGDLIHTMPAVTDLQQHFPDAELHWLVEEAFHDIPYWHPYVKKVHCCAIRRWRKSLLKSDTRQEIKQLKAALLDEHFDYVIDAQGLFKSAWMVRWLGAHSHGYDRRSIREPIASLFYQNRHAVSRKLTAIERVRVLFSAAFGYSVNSSIDFGLHINRPANDNFVPESPFVVFLHGTNWSSKVWPVAYWQTLASNLIAEGKTVLLPWGDEAEKKVALQIAEASGAMVLDKLSLNHLAYLIQQANFVIGSDTGLTHISAALGTQSIGLYGSTSSALTGLVGNHVVSLQSKKDCSPCMQRQCPLIDAGELIPCYPFIGPETVLTTIHRIESDLGA